MKFTAALSAIALALATTCEAVTHRQAQVTVQNNTPNNILSISLVHKYSDNYKNEMQWPILHPGDGSWPLLTADYNTGITTTGRDWWLLTWYSEDLKTQYYTDPNNFRGVFDALDKVAPDAIQAVIGSAAALITSETGPVAAAAAAAAVALAKETTKYMFNSEGTDGFKQHILRSEDANAITNIIINGDGTVTFQSRSGTSSTVYTAKATKLE
ncbi:hypothetical protein VHEMI09177 [[Torrubiella] hemipterigena]|uniref:Up-regulated in Daf-2 domain-containing protein n=1 Tax=[Torrubiella] hemipterigena TaxID=1531966 RepID=A0A0A1TFP2_9HYPO|nr:hypothetical protein VHEMI09177 [[Torrubiella] hemipterigena]